MLLILLLSVFSVSGTDFGPFEAVFYNTEATEKFPTTSNLKSQSGTAESASDSKAIESLTEPIEEAELAEAVSNKKTPLTFGEEKVEPKESTASVSESVSRNMNTNYSGSGDRLNANTMAKSNSETKENTTEPTPKTPKATEEQLPSNEQEELEVAEVLSVDDKAEVNAVSNEIRTHEMSAALNETSTSKIGLLTPVRPSLLADFFEDGLKNLEVPKATGKDIVGAKKHEVFIGAHANFNLPLIFNQNTYGAFDGKELAYKPTFGMASGARIGYTFKRQYGFQTGFIFYSRQGQDYSDNLNGSAARRQVKLQYFHVPIILRYKFKIKKQQKFESPWVINLGTDIGILRSAEITYSGNEYSLGPISNPEANDIDYFKPIDVSVVLGVEKEIYFTKWLMMSLGIRTTFSGDINADGHPVENDGNNYDKSHNFTFGFTLGFNYYLRR